jgi:hypothetical protein
LHRLPHHPHQIIAQGVQLRLFAEPRREGFQGLPGIVLAAVEAPIYERLDAPPQRSEKRRGLPALALIKGGSLERKAEAIGLGADEVVSIKGPTEEIIAAVERLIGPTSE